MEQTDLPEEIPDNVQLSGMASNNGTPFKKIKYLEEGDRWLITYRKEVGFGFGNEIIIDNVIIPEIKPFIRIRHIATNNWGTNGTRIQVNEEYFETLELTYNYIMNIKPKKKKDRFYPLDSEELEEYLGIKLFERKEE